MAHTTPLQKVLSPPVFDTKGLSMPDNKNILIFLVDDDEVYIRLLKAQFCENPDLEIKTFLTGEGCLQNISLKPDVIVLDYFLNTADKY